MERKIKFNKTTNQKNDMHIYDALVNYDNKVLIIEFTDYFGYKETIKCFEDCVQIKLDIESENEYIFNKTHGLMNFKYNGKLVSNPCFMINSLEYDDNHIYVDYRNLLDDSDNTIDIVVEK